MEKTYARSTNGERERINHSIKQRKTLMHSRRSEKISYDVIVEDTQGNHAGHMNESSYRISKVVTSHDPGVSHNRLVC
jgi:hypothetical protein